MSKICSSQDVQAALKSGAEVFVLFYADWCPFSQAFLPAYEKHAAGRDNEFLRVLFDGNQDLFDKHSINVYPTVLFFKGGQVFKRLDGKHLAGLKEKELAELIATCGKSRD